MLCFLQGRGIHNRLRRRRGKGGLGTGRGLVGRRLRSADWLERLRRRAVSLGRLRRADRSLGGGRLRYTSRSLGGGGLRRAGRLRCLRRGTCRLRCLRRARRPGKLKRGTCRLGRLRRTGWLRGLHTRRWIAQRTLSLCLRKQTCQETVLDEMPSYLSTSEVH